MPISSPHTDNLRGFLHTPTLLSRGKVLSKAMLSKMTVLLTGDVTFYFQIGKNEIIFKQE